MTPGFASASISQALVEMLQQHADFAFLMGSAETERFHAESDIDVAVFWKSAINDQQRSTLWRQLEAKFNRDVDLVALNSIDDIFARQVLEKGRLLFSSSDGLLLNCKMQKMATYPDFKSSRKIIEDHILKRKKYV